MAFFDRQFVEQAKADFQAQHEWETSQKLAKQREIAQYKAWAEQIDAELDQAFAEYPALLRSLGIKPAEYDVGFFKKKKVQIWPIGLVPYDREDDDFAFFYYVDNAGEFYRREVYIYSLYGIVTHTEKEYLYRRIKESLVDPSDNCNSVRDYFNDILSLFKQKYYHLECIYNTRRNSRSSNF